MIDRIAGNSRQIAFYLLTGFFFSLTFSIALAQMLMGTIIILVLISLFDRKQRDFPSGFRWLFITIALFVVWSIIASLCGPTPLKSLLVGKEEWLFMIIPVTAYLVTDKKKIYILVTALALSTLLVSIYAAFQHFTGMDLLAHNVLPMAPEHGYRVTGTFSNRLTFGHVFVVAAVFLLATAPSIRNINRRIIFYVSFAMASLGVIFTYSRGPIAVLALTAGVLFISNFRRHLKTITLMILLLILAIVLFTPDIFSGYIKSAKGEWNGTYPGSRLFIWRTTLRMAQAHPLFGVGQGNFEEQFGKYRDPKSRRIYGHGHNDVLNIAAYAGFPGAIFFLGFWIIMFILMVKALGGTEGDSVVRAVMIGVFVASIAFFLTSFYEATFADEEPRQLLMALWGLFIGCAGIVKGGSQLPIKGEKA